MSIYRVYLPPEAAGNFSQNFQLVPDTKAIFALIAPPIWLVWHRLWLPLLVYIVVIFAISLLSSWQPGGLVAVLSALPGLYLFLEGRELVANKFRSNGWQEVAAIEAQNSEAAEIKYILNADETGLLNNLSDRDANPVKSATSYNIHSSVGLFPE